MTTLSYSATTITLPDDMAWPDEYTWRAVAQSHEYTLTGALIVESALRLVGCPITLTGDESGGWVARSVVDSLRVMASLPGQQFILTLRSVAYTVMFDHEAGALDARPVLDYSDPIAGDPYVVTLRFFKV
jgi:hypothetical protein